jgi:hypothetical protein
MTDIDINDITEEMAKINLKLVKSRINSTKCYNRRIQNEPDFYKNEKIRIREYNKNRYKNDPVFAEKIKSKRREVYAIKKEEKKQLALNTTNDIIT